MKNERISDKFSYPAHYVDVLGSKMHFIEEGTGDPILFLHGVPTSCYVWRNVIPHLTSLGKCIAPDLIGFGKSAKPNIDYSIFDHIKYIEKFIEVMKLKNITFIMHGWGSIIGFDYAMRHENNCKGLVFYEAFLRKLHENENSLPLQEQVALLQAGTSDLAADATYFVDRVIAQGAMRELSEEEMANYREPFLHEGTSKPILQYLKEIPVGNGKTQIEQLIIEYSKKLTHSKLPKLMLYSVPGFITTMATAIWAKEHLPNLEIVDVGEELHLAQESYPQLIGETISVWLQGVEQARMEMSK